MGRNPGEPSGLIILLLPGATTKVESSAVPLSSFPLLHNLSHLAETSIWPRFKHLCMLQLLRVRTGSLWPPLAFVVRGRTWLPIKTRTLKASPQEGVGFDDEQPRNDKQSLQLSCLLSSVHRRHRFSPREACWAPAFHAWLPVSE